MKKTGIIGGSGLEKPEILKTPRFKKVSTPYGNPSSELICGQIEGKDVVILSRHGFQHTIPPSQVNNRANIFALREEGCTEIIATTACGSLREEIKRGDIVIPDQLIDFTRHREITFFTEFEPGNMKHAAMADPFDASLRATIISAASEADIRVHDKGTLVTIEGPRFSTRAESKMFRLWGADIINMSVAPEVILSNELGIPYATIAMSTDYDSWKDDEEPVSWEEVLRIFRLNAGRVVGLLRKVISLVK